MLKTLILVLMTLSFCGTLGAFPQSEEIAFTKEASSALRQFNEKFYTSISGTTETLQVFPEEGSVPSRTVVYAKGDNFSVTLSGMVPPYDNEVLSVYCKNPQYGFKASGNDKKGWRLEKCAPFESENFLKYISLDAENPIFINCSPAHFFVTSLDRLISDSSFRIKDLKKTSEDLTTVQFQVVGKPECQALTKVVSGKLQLDGARNWMPRSVEINFVGGPTVIRNCKYREGAQLPYSEEIEVKHNGVTAQKIATTMNWDFSGNKVDDREFYLSKYGIPEPPWASRPWKWSSIFWICLAVVLLISVVWKSRKNQNG